MDDAINNGNKDGLEQPKKRKRGGSNESDPIIISPVEHHQMKTDADVWCKSGDARKLLCVLHEIPTVITVENFREGWEQGRAKDLLQVLWERAFIDSTNLSKYALTGKRELGIFNNVNSLRHIMGMCADFLNEEGMLQYIATKIGVTVLLTPKCHAELAGEGIEYMWACSKGAYRNLSLKENKGKENFNASVGHCCLSEQLITVRRIRKFAQRARLYLMAYHAIDFSQVDQQTQQGYSKYGPVALTRLINEFKTHRCAFDFDYKFIWSVMNDD